MEALLVIDVQNGVMEACWEREAVIARISALVERARAAGAPVVWVQHEDEELVRGEHAWEFVPELVPAHGELVLDKRHNDAFDETLLESTLRTQGIESVVICGAQSNYCIRRTVDGALGHRLGVTLAADAHTTEDTRRLLADGTWQRWAAEDVVVAVNSLYAQTRTSKTTVRVMQSGELFPSL